MPRPPGNLSGTLRVGPAIYSLNSFPPSPPHPPRFWPVGLGWWRVFISNRFQNGVCPGPWTTLGVVLLYEIHFLGRVGCSLIFGPWPWCQERWQDIDALISYCPQLNCSLCSHIEQNFLWRRIAWGMSRHLVVDLKNPKSFVGQWLLKQALGTLSVFLFFLL